MKRVMIAAIACVACVALVPSAATAGDKTETKVSIGDYVPDMSYWYGYVKSDKKACKDDRKVTLYRKQEGSDEKIGSDRSEPGKLSSYTWEVEQSPSGGDYYAKTDATDKCGGDKSKIYPYETR
jgi:hypothetical protein